MIRRLIALAVGAALLTSCTSKESDMAMTDEVADQTRSTIDALAADVGRVTEVQMDTVTACVPGDDSSGEELVYALALEVEPGTLERVRGEIADRYRADGWEVYPRGSENTAFRRDGMTVGATVRADGTARVSGSSGCQG